MIKLLDLLKEDSPFVPKGSKEEREKDYNRIAQNKIQQYIKDRSKGDLDLTNTPITSLPDELTKVGGDLYLSFTPITSLPSNLRVGGNLYLNNSKITKLPDNLTVGGDLNLFRTPITTLPSNLKVKDNLYLKNTPLSKNHSEEEIRAMVPNVEGEIIM
jgi:hypothetical protein